MSELDTPTLYQLIAEQVGTAVTIYTCIQDVLGSNPGQNTRDSHQIAYLTPLSTSIHIAYPVVAEQRPSGDVGRCYEIQGIEGQGELGGHQADRQGALAMRVQTVRVLDTDRQTNGARSNYNNTK